MRRFIGSRWPVTGDETPSSRNHSELSFLVLTSTFTEFFARGRLSFAAHIAAGVIEVSCMIAVTLLFYDIFKPVNRRLSLLAASFNFVAITILLLQFLPHSVNIGSDFTDSIGS